MDHKNLGKSYEVYSPFFQKELTERLRAIFVWNELLPISFDFFWRFPSDAVFIFDQDFKAFLYISMRCLEGFRPILTS